MRCRLPIALIAAIVGGNGPSAFAQAIQQAGPIVPFHASSWFTNGAVQDAGAPSTPYLSALGLFGGATCPFGVSSQSGPGLSTNPYSLFTICQSDSATTLTVAGINGEPTPNVYFNIGGVNYPFPGPGNGTVVGPSSATIGDVACYAATTGQIILDCGSKAVIVSSPSLVSAVSSLPTCNSGLEGARRGVTDAANPSYLAPVYGGGTVHVGVGCNGSVWVAGY